MNQNYLRENKNVDEKQKKQKTKVKNFVESVNIDNIHTNKHTDKSNQTNKTKQTKSLPLDFQSVMQ